MKKGFGAIAGALLLLSSGCSMMSVFAGSETLEEQLQKCKLANAAPPPGFRDVAMEKALTLRAAAMVDKKFDAGEFKASYLYAIDATWAPKKGYKVFKNAKGEVIGQGNEIVVNGRTINAVLTGRTKRGTCAAIPFTITQGVDGQALGDFDLSWGEKADLNSGAMRLPCRSK